jgi:hypothetical protein
MAKATPSVAAEKHMRALLQSHAERQKKQDARLELRMRIKQHGLAVTARMDRERLQGVRADTPLTARTAASMGGVGSIPSTVGSARMSARTASIGSASVGSARMSVGSAATPMTVQLSPRSIARSYSLSRPASTAGMSSRTGSVGSVGSLVRQFEGLGHAGGIAPTRRPPNREDLSRYKR